MRQTVIVEVFNQLLKTIIWLLISGKWSSEMYCSPSVSLAVIGYKVVELFIEGRDLRVSV